MGNKTSKNRCVYTEEEMNLLLKLQEQRINEEELGRTDWDPSWEDYHNANKHIQRLEEWADVLQGRCALSHKLLEKETKQSEETNEKIDAVFSTDPLFYQYGSKGGSVLKERRH